MKKRHHTPEQIIRKLAEGDKLLKVLRNKAAVLGKKSCDYLLDMQVVSLHSSRFVCGPTTRRSANQVAFRNPKRQHTSRYRRFVSVDQIILRFQ